MDGPPDSTQSLKSARRLFEVIECLEERQPIGVTELSEATGIPTSSVQVYLNTLRDAEYVVKEDGRYRLSLRFFEHGMNGLRQFEIYQTARPKVYQIAEETGELVGAFVEERGRAIYAMAAGGENAIRTDLKIGSHTGLHCTAGGKAILAYLPEERVAEVIETRGLPAHTDGTITDPETLYAELETIRERGVAFNREESIAGMHAVAAPIRARGEVIGAISVSGPSTRFVGDLFETELVALVKQTANEITLNLDYDETVY